MSVECPALLYSHLFFVERVVALSIISQLVIEVKKLESLFISMLYMLVTWKKMVNLHKISNMHLKS